jgi:GT2 family glycosyltransferase
LEDLLTGCIVLYKNEIVMLKKAINSFFNSKLNLKLYLIDNSPTDDLKVLVTDSRIEYFHNTHNDGFGKAHNIAIRRAQGSSKYHLILNPDIYFDDQILVKLKEFMDSDCFLGIVTPNVIYPDGTLQPLAKLLPTPLDLLFRRIVPFESLKKWLVRDYEMQKYQYDKVINVPFLSGCFMLCRSEVLNRIGGFDENIFMYTEDIDLCRRVNEIGFRTIIFPFVTIVHDHEKKSFLKFGTFKTYFISSIYYFNKWGWIFDYKRKKINRAALKQF